MSSKTTRSLLIHLKIHTWMYQMPTNIAGLINSFSTLKIAHGCIECLLPIPPTSIGQNNSPSFSPLRRLSRKWRQLKIAVSLLATLENCNRSSLRHHLFMIVCHHLPSIVITIITMFITIVVTIIITITISLETPTSSPRPSEHRNLTQMPLMQRRPILAKTLFLIIIV